MACRFALETAKLDFTPVDNVFVTQYMVHASGVQVQVYLYGLMQCYHTSMLDVCIADALNLKEEQVLEAFSYWQAQGLVRIVSVDPLEVNYLSLRQRLSHADAPAIAGKYHALVQAAQALVAPRQFTSSELKHVYDWIEVFGLEEAAVLELIAYCIQLKGKRVRITYMDSVAKSFVDAGVQSANDAQHYIHDYQERTGGAQNVLKRWRISRRATEDELALYSKWKEQWGFTDDAILAACSALTKAEHPSFQYLNGVLENLSSAHVKTAPDIAAYFETQDEDAALARNVFQRAGIARSARPNERAQLAMFMKEWGMPMELLLFAAEQANGMREPFGYLKKLLCQWHADGVCTVSAAQAYKKEVPAAKEKTPRALKYLQRTYSEQELEHLTVNLDEDL